MTADISDGAFVHEPVLLSAIESLVSFAQDAVVVDATVGHGGHALALGGRLGTGGMLVALDVDTDSISTALPRLNGLSCRCELVHENFGLLDKVLDRFGIGQVDVILADLGLCSGQLATGEKGFSFQHDGPLDMRLDSRLNTTAEQLVNTLKQDDLANLIYNYVQERKSRRIARAIVSARHIKPIKLTSELVDVINAAFGLKGTGRRSKIHPATRTFQALRIAVNDELGQLERLLSIAASRLKVGGYVAVISFHSLEDRMVKHDFRARRIDGSYELITRKPVVADEAERLANPRSRSAKLRVAKRRREELGI